MRTKRISFITLFVVMIAAFAMSFVTGANVAKAEPTFAFENGAYVKLGGDGGLRFRLEMDETTANGIKENANETLYFYVASAARMSSVTDGAGAKVLNTSENAWEVAVDPDKIYLGTDAEDNEFYFANVLIDLNTLGATNGAYYTTDFVAAATVYDSSSMSYTKFVKSVERSLQDTASAGALRAGYYSEVSSTYAWLGTSYPIVAKTAEDYEVLKSMPDISSLYFEIVDVEDTEGLVDNYGTAMRSGGAADVTTNENYKDYKDYYQSYAVLETDLDVGTVVEVQMDVYVTGSFEGNKSAIQTVDTVYNPNGGEANEGKDITALVTGESGWHTITFLSTVRNFDKLRYNLAYGVQDTSSYVNGIYIISNNKSLKSFNYKNVEITAIGGTALKYGGVNKTNSAKHQSATGLSTDLPVGTAVSVTMDVYVTGTFDSSSAIYLVDSVWSAAGGERNAVTDIMSTIVTGESGWHTVTFTATVRNFPNLRHNSNYETIIDTSSFGNAVYLLTDNGSVAAFNYKNVEIIVEGMTDGGKNSANNYYQTMTGLKTDLEVGTSVTVTMDVKLTSASAFDQYSSLYWVDSVGSNNVPISSTSIKTAFTDLDDTTNWQTITFTATVRNFEQLRANEFQYSSIDTSAFGNAVYILGQANGTGNPLIYKNVEIQIPESMTNGVQKTVSPNGFYSAIKGIPTQFELDTAVTVEMDIKITGTAADAYVNSSIYWIDNVDSSSNLIKSKTLIYAAPQSDVPTGWIHISFDAAVRNFSSVTNSSEYAAFDTSACGNGIYLCAHNFKSTASFVYKNIQITNKGYKAPIQGGNNGNNSDIYYQSVTGLSTDFAVGTTVIVDMDVFVTGTFNNYSHIYWVNDVYTTSGGESDKSRTDIKSTIVTGVSGWHHVTFTATVRNFSVLRLNSGYPTIDTSAYGNAVYLISMNKSADSFNYKNVVITAA